MAELTLEESIQQIFPTLPLPLQKFFEQRGPSETAHLLMERYALHVDQGTILEQELMFLLLGLRSPDEFAEELYAQLPISRQTVLDIITDVNQEVFVPLREEEMKSGGARMEQQVKSAAASAPPRPMNIPVPNYAPRPPEVSKPPGVMEPPPQSPTYFHSEDRIVSQPIISVIRPPAGGSERRPPRPVVTAPARPLPRVTDDAAKPMPDEKLLEDHEEAHINFDKTSVPPNLPGVLPSIQPKPTPPVASIPSAPPPISSKPYSVDPYREPIDENSNA